eukprot:GFUD01015735.1.p1 GENE.GFUD01015735.1~~GFUD01015735.1.p1  ORF type:complete len:1457 (+),score=298.41 GFUD01015735.1:266-4636(+)
MGRTVLVIVSVLVSACIWPGQGRDEETSMHACSGLGMQLHSTAAGEDGSRIVFCRNMTDGTVRGVTQIGQTQVLVTQNAYQNGEQPQICSEEEKSKTKDRWSCKSVTFIVPKSDENTFYAQTNTQSSGRRRVPRQAGEPDLILPHLQKKNVNFSVLNVAGIDWVCEQLSETQCKPLWPKVNKKNPEQTWPRPQALQSSSEQQGSNSEPSTQYLTDDRLDSISKIVNDDARWQWSQGGGVGGGNSQTLREGGSNNNNIQGSTNPQPNVNGTGQYVYNINGITWLCRQFKQLQCYPIFSPWDGKGDPPGLSTAQPGFQNQPGLNAEDPGYPDYPGGRSFQEYPPKTTPSPTIVANRRVDNNWEYQNIGRSTQPPVTFGPQPRPPHKRTTFCSRSIRFKAKDEVVLRYNTYKGTMRMYIQAVRRPSGQVVINARMLRDNEDGLGEEENKPAVIIAADVNCDTITLTVGSKVYKIDYDFGRSGVKDLEVVGNLESTGMVPRSKSSSSNQNAQRQVSNFIEIDDFAEIQLRPSPTTIIDNSNTDSNSPRDDDIGATQATEEEDQDEELPVTEDNFKIDGQGDVQVSLGEGLNKQHRYQISRGQDGEVNIEVLVGEGLDNAEKSLVIDNKDYNYTLVVTGQNFQIIHHDTNRNLTYRHGLNEKDISGVGISGDIRGTSTAFKERSDIQGTARLFPQKRVLQGVSIFGNLCLSQCLVTSDNSYYCEVKGGTSEQCGPDPNLTPLGEECADECRKRDDDYFWCQRDNKPWDYCSPPLIFQQKLRCPDDAERMMTPDPTDCARYLTCERGSVKLEECPEGLHYIHRNRTCEWPVGGQCSDPFGRSSIASSEPPSSLNDKPNLLPLLTSTRSDSDNYPARTTPHNTKTTSEAGLRTEYKSEVSDISIEEVFETTEQKLSTEYFDEDSISTLNDLLAFLNSTAEEEYPQSLNTLENDPLDPTTPQYVIINKEDRQIQRTSSRYPSTLFDDGQYQASSARATTNNRILTPQVTESQTNGITFSDSFQNTRRPSDDTGDVSIVFGNKEIPSVIEPLSSNNGQNAPTRRRPAYTTNTIVAETEPIGTERELLYTAEDNYRPTVWTQRSTQKSPSRTSPVFTIPAQYENPESRTSGNNRVRFPSTTQLDDANLFQTETQQSSYRTPQINTATDSYEDPNISYRTTLIQNQRTPQTPNRNSQTNPAINPSQYQGIESRTIDGRNPDTTGTTTTNIQDNTNRSFPRRLFEGVNNDANSITDSSKDESIGGSVIIFTGTSPTSKITTSRPVSARTISNTRNNGLGSQSNTRVGDIDTQAILAKAKDFKDGLTSHGELCTDACEKRGYPYYWCHKESSNLGQWWDSDFCSPFSTVTHYGKECEDECEQRGEKYFWCHRKIDGGWGYCSPNTVYKEGVCSSNNGYGDGFYALVGDCERYISCRGGRPIIFSCEKTLYFDYILQSCTFEKDARCIGV